MMGAATTVLAAWLAAAFLCAGARAENWVYPEPIASWDEQTTARQRKAAEALVADLAAATARGDKEFTVPPGDYRFSGAATEQFAVKASGLRINAHGATFWFHGRKRIDALVVKDSANVTVAGLTIDYDPFSYSQGEVLRVDPQTKTVDIRIDPGFPHPDETWTRVPGSIKAIFFDPTGAPREIRMDWVKALEPLGGGVYRVSFKENWIFVYECGIAAGDRLVLPDRQMRMACTVVNSEAVTLEDITIYAAPHMALTEATGAGGHVYRRCKVIRRPGTRRLLACNADVFHSVKVAKGPLIEECEFSWACDDLINIHSFFSPILEQRSPTQVVAAPFYAPDIYDGTELEFFDWQTVRPLGAAKALKVTPIEDPAVAARAKAIPDTLRAAGEKVADFSSGRVFPCLVELDRPVQVKPHDVAVSYERAGRGARIRNNYLHDTPCTAGMKLKSRDVVVENNRIERTGSPGILAASDVYFWEGPFSRDIVIRGNRIVDCGYTLHSRLRAHGFHAAISVYTAARKFGFAREGFHNANIVIADNTIIRPAAVGIFMANTRGGRIERNRIEQPAFKPPLPQTVQELRNATYAVYLTGTQDVTVTDNAITNLTPHCRGEVGP